MGTFEGYTVYPMTMMGAVGTIGQRLADRGVLSAALGVFERKGYAATSVEDILAAAGIARRTFYKRFKSKEDVLVALYSAAMSEIMAALQTARPESDHPFAAIHHAIDVYLDYHTKNASTLRMLLGEAMRPESRMYAMRRVFRGALVQILSDTARKRHKDFAPLVLVGLVGLLEGMSIEILETGVKPADIEVVRQTCHAMLAKVFDVKGPPLPRARRP